MRSLKMMLAALAIAVLTTGCAVNRTSAMVDPATKFDTLKSFHVKPHDKDERNVDKLIADNLRARGFKVSTGKEPAGPVDAVVTYVDKWMWDITMYMIQLDVQVRDPGSQVVMASATSYRPSLQRVAPDKMVEEVVNEIFKQ